jgi:hypothetical protein
MCRVLVDGIQVQKVGTVSQSKSNNVYLGRSNTLCTLATLGAHSPTLCTLVHLEPLTHLGEILPLAILVEVEERD